MEEARAAIAQRAEEQWARYAVLAEVAEMVEAGRGIPHSSGCNGKTCQPDCPLKTRPVARNMGRQRKGRAWRRPHAQRRARQTTPAQPALYRVADEDGDPKVCRKKLTKQSEWCMEQRGGTARGRRFHGVKADGDNTEFFLPKRSIGEMMSKKHVEKSANPESHFAAAANVMELWEQSVLVEKHRDKKKPFDESELLWVHRRRAFMRHKGRLYSVLLTAKEFKDKKSDPILYQVKTKYLQ